MPTRAERAALNPVKDQERARLIQPYRTALEGLRAQTVKAPDAAPQVEEFRWLLEEYKVSVFAQELGTALPVSPKRLDQSLGQASGHPLFQSHDQDHQVDDEQQHDGQFQHQHPAVGLVVMQELVEVIQRAELVVDRVGASPPGGSAPRSPRKSGRDANRRKTS